MQHHVNDLMKSHLVDYSIEPNSRPCRVYELSLEKEDVTQPLLHGQVKMAYDEREKSYMCLLIDKPTDREIEYISYSFRIDSNLFWAQLKSKPAVCTFRNKAHISDKTPTDVIYAMKFESDGAASEFCDKLDEVLKEMGVTLARNNQPRAAEKKKKRTSKKREDSTRLDRQ